MANILIAYGTGEGQTARIAETLAGQFQSAGHTAEMANLGDAEPDVSPYDAIVVAGSVHAGKHQDSIRDFVSRHREALQGMPTAFLSVSLATVATTSAGRDRAAEQVTEFLREVDWQPVIVEQVGGAFRYSEFSPLKRTVFRLSQWLFKKELGRQGWPDLTTDSEFTDWSSLRRFGERFLASL